MIITIFGTTINLMSVMIVLLILGIIVMFWRIHRSDKLDFTDMITKDGRTVSLTKVLQLIGGTTATWVVIKLAITGTLGADIFGIYLAYVASIEGFSKFMTAKYRYQEQSVRDTSPYSSGYSRPVGGSGAWGSPTRPVRNAEALDRPGPTGSAKADLDDE